MPNAWTNNQSVISPEGVNISLIYAIILSTRKDEKQTSFRFYSNSELYKYHEAFYLMLLQLTQFTVLKCYYYIFFNDISVLDHCRQMTCEGSLNILKLFCASRTEICQPIPCETPRSVLFFYVPSTRIFVMYVYISDKDWTLKHWDL